MSNNKKSSVVDWMFDQLFINPKSNLREIMEQAKAMEKEQIEDAHHCGRTFENKYPDSIKTYNESAEQYYNETYGNE